MDYLSKDISCSINKCRSDDLSDFIACKGFDRIYPFTTEMISGYIKHFDLNNKSLFTVGSSSDQAINGLLFGSFEQTIYDICPYTKYYFYLKKSAILELSYSDYLSFFCGNKDSFVKNNELFNIKCFKRISERLKELNYESYVYWTNIFSLFDGKTIKDKLFTSDEMAIDRLKIANNYLKDERSYEKVKKLIGDFNPNFIVGNIYDINFTGSFDNINLSNICCYNENVGEYKDLVAEMSQHLNTDGIMLFLYLYNLYNGFCFKPDFKKIYDIDNTRILFKDFISEEININLSSDKAFVYKRN